MFNVDLIFSVLNTCSETFILCSITSTVVPTAKEYVTNKLVANNHKRTNAFVMNFLATKIKLLLT